MKNNLPITDQENHLTDQTQLVTTTDLKGKITYCNQEFIDISGFSHDELIGTSHNIVRHPDMPPEAFDDLWNSLKQQKSWLGIVKNRSKNGNYYWVEAYVTPVFENKQVVGYESVRVKPQAECIDRAEKLYQRINNGYKKLPPSFSLKQLFPAMLSLVSLAICAAVFLLTDIELKLIVFTGVAWTALAGLGSYLLLSKLTSVVDYAENITSNRITQHIITGINGDAGKLLLAMKMKQAKLRTVLGRVNASINSVTSVALETASASNSMTLQIEQQQKDVTTLATAIEEMSASIAEVASSASSVSKTAKQTNKGSILGKQAVHEATDSTGIVSEKVIIATNTINKLEKESESIDAVLVVIRGIAEQTNLLALNAAIEAARAGEQGRGFAVVADEVRTLASRTQSSTEEIQKMIEKLQENSRSAVKVMQSSTLGVEQSVKKTQQVGERLDDIFNSVDQLNQMNISIAEATEEQSIVANEISQNVHSISSASEQLTLAANSTSQASTLLADLSKDLRCVVSRFKD